jgi:hypothetical protein
VREKVVVVWFGLVCICKDGGCRDGDSAEQQRPDVRGRHRGHELAHHAEGRHAAAGPAHRGAQLECALPGALPLPRGSSAPNPYHSPILPQSIATRGSPNVPTFRNFWTPDSTGNRFPVNVLIRNVKSSSCFTLSHET